MNFSPGVLFLTFSQENLNQLGEIVLSNMTGEAIKQEIHNEFFKLLKNKIPENILINLQTELKKEEQIKENTFIKIIMDSPE